MTLEWLWIVEFERWLPYLSAGAMALLAIVWLVDRRALNRELISALKKINALENKVKFENQIKVQEVKNGKPGKHDHVLHRWWRRGIASYFNR